MIGQFANRNVLLLQGPMGPFFHRLAEDLRNVGAKVHKINFNSGDALFFPGPEAIAFRGTREEWPAFLTATLRRLGCDTLVLFGDCRPYHRVAIEIANAENIKVFVFEEGYVRPDFITLEQHGVNGNSRLSRDPEFYRSQPTASHGSPQPVGNSFWHLMGFTIAYALACTLLKSRYPNYQHHKDVHAWRQTAIWVRGAFRKLKYSWAQRRVLERIVGTDFFLVPLQVGNDAQLEHSRFSSVVEFIQEVVASFSRHARTESKLVIKHHPLDRAYTDYTSLIEELREKHGLGERLVYVHDLHLPTLLKHARGTVVINSTVGLSSLFHHTPVKVLGVATYDIVGLTSQRPLNEFWLEQDPVDAELHAAYTNWLRAHVLANGNFFRRLPDVGSTTGVDWRRPQRGGEVRPVSLSHS